MLKLDPTPKVITFDCYGTLVQWHGAVREAAEVIVSEHTRAGDTVGQPDAFAVRLREIAMEEQQRPLFRDYSSILRSSLAEALSEIGCTVTTKDWETLLAILKRIKPHPEVRAALDRLRTRYRLAIISNTDEFLIAGTVAAIGTPIDFVITAEGARAYKPDHELFLHAYKTMQVTQSETIHVGMGQFTDLKVCHELGIRSVWINRAGELLNPDLQPHAILDDLSGLPTLLMQP